MSQAVATFTQSHVPVIVVRDGRPLADSRNVAASFGKRHGSVLCAIRNLQCSDNFKQRNFMIFKRWDLTGESTSHILMTKDGFYFVVLAFTGGKAARFKEAFIEAFNRMEAELHKRPGQYNTGLNDSLITPQNETVPVPVIINGYRVSSDLPNTVVYFAKDDYGFVKIGYTAYLEHRIKTLNAGTSSQLRFIRILKGAGQPTETWLHNRFKTQRVWGKKEWFTYTRDMLTVIPPEEEPTQIIKPTNEECSNRLKSYSNAITLKQAELDGYSVVTTTLLR